MSYNFSNVPTELTELNRWATYKLEPKPDDPNKMNKKPRNDTGRVMKWGDPANWLSHNEALTGLRAKPTYLDGLGLFLGAGIYGFDIDGCIDERGVIADDAMAIINMINSYTEKSPSGTGVHILFKSAAFEFESKRNDALGYELYNSDNQGRGRFFTVTGDVLPGFETIRDASKEIEQIYFEYFAERPTPSVETPAKLQTAVQRITKTATVETAPDDELLAFMFDTYNGAQSLYRGDMSGYSKPVKDRNGNITGYADDHSRADLALCTYLVAVCHGDTARADSLFRQSGLYRDKWNEKHGSETYGAMTLGKALTGYDASKAPNFLVWQAEKIAYEATETAQRGDYYENGISTVENENPASTDAVAFLKSVSDYLQLDYPNDLNEFAAGRGVYTGWHNLDSQINSLYPGLYVIGAPPGRGKTTFCYQLCENLAEQGQTVLYFALEQSRLELVSKSIARRAFQRAENGKTYSSLYIRAGYTDENTEQATLEFKESNAAKNMYIIESDFDLAAEQLKRTVEGYIAQTGIKPVVCIDYLQLLSTEDKYARDRAKVEQVVRVVKSLQRDNKLILLAISSYSRDNYDEKTTLASSKESGLIEFSADVVLGIDYAYMHEWIPGDSAKERKEWLNKQKREAPKQTPRKMMLACVKNRMGMTYKNAFNYYSKYDLFVEPMHDDKPKNEQENDGFSGIDLTNATVV